MKANQSRLNELTDEYAVILYMFIHAYPSKDRVQNQDRYIERAKKRVQDAVASEDAAKTALATAAATRAALQEDLDKAQAIHAAFKVMQEQEEAEADAKAQEAAAAAAQEASSAPPWRRQPSQPSPFTEADHGRPMAMVTPPSPFVTAMGTSAAQMPLTPQQAPQQTPQAMPQVIAQLQAGQSTMATQLSQLEMGADGLPEMTLQELNAMREATGLKVGASHLKSHPLLPGQTPLPWPVQATRASRRGAPEAHPDEPAEKSQTLPHAGKDGVDIEVPPGDAAAAAAAGQQLFHNPNGAQQS
ncbi:unnamed protein product [Prorocentrum cordatum]|uniref:Uncharacterized protein n=1 Tax=Prorocentrum cordatum TaxID=2364126 RepID=A0ABN9PMH1_9DINO|nr:unnamed protein product [Polarella glacialis]